MSPHAGKAVIQADNGVDQNAHHNDHQQEAGAAAGVEAALGPDVFHRQLLAMLIAEDGLMLRPVIGEETLDIAHAGAEHHIQQQNDHLGEALGQVADNEALRQGFDEAHNQGGKEDEQQQSQGNAQHHRGADDQLLSLFGGEVVSNPLINFIRFLLLLLRDEAGGIGQGLHALDHGVQKDGAAPDEGPAQNGVLLLIQLQLLHLFHQTILGAADDGLLFGATHQDALNQGLAADGGAEGTGIVVFAHRSLFLLMQR